MFKRPFLFFLVITIIISTISCKKFKSKNFKIGIRNSQEEEVIEHHPESTLENDEIILIKSANKDFYLNGHTSHPKGLVDLKSNPLNVNLSGCRWRLMKAGQFFRFKNLGFENGNRRWLDGHLKKDDELFLKANLAPSFDGIYVGTKWKLIENENGYYIKNFSSEIYLSESNNNIELSSQPYAWNIIQFDHIPIDSDKFLNPIIDNSQDPWVFKYNNMYHYCHSKGGKIYLTSSDSLHTLGKKEEKMIFHPPTGSSYSNHIWAPEIHEINDKFYLYFTAGKDNQHTSNQRIHVAEANTLDAPFEYRGRMAYSNEEKWAIDGTVLKKDTKLYFLWSGLVSGSGWTQGIYISEMASPITLATQGKLISSPQYVWERIGGNVNEAPQVLWNNNKLFIVYSASLFSSNHYSLGLLEWNGNNLLKHTSWIKSPESVFKNNNYKLGPFSPGHCSFSKSKNEQEDWIIYHTGQYSNSKGTRWISIKKFGWNLNGTPDFGDPILPFIPMTKPN